MVDVKVDHGTIWPLESLQRSVDGWNKGPLAEFDAIAADQMS